MARPARPGRPGKAKFSSHKANAAGYAKRHSNKSKIDFADVYDYQPEKVRRGNVSLTLDKDEAAEFGDEGSEEDDINHTALKARLIGENVDDEKIDSEDDEELDSDEAFEESDEEKYAGFSFGPKKKKQSKAKKSTKPKKSSGVRFAEVDLNEDDSADEGSVAQDASNDEDDEEEEEEEGDSDEFIDVLDVLDGRGEPDLGENEAKESSAPKVDTRDRVEDEDEDMEDDEDEVEDEDEENSDDSGEGEVDEVDVDVDISADEADESPDALENLGKFVSSLDTGTKRKAEDPEVEGPQRKKRYIKERTEAGAENEFAANIAGSERLNLDDLLEPLAAQSSNLISLKKSAKALTSSRVGGAPLSAPLPQRTQDRLDREAAYEQTKEEVDKWKDTMKRIKEAEHLSFPLQAQKPGKPSNLELSAKFKPTTELESAVDKLLKKAKMREEDLARTEELKMNHLSVEEVAARRAEVRKLRELMFRAEVKAKRVAKIKSKTYRRMKKKEREKLAAKLGEDEVDDDDEEARMKREAERALERATLRHKNTGKWAKAMKGRGELDEDQRREITEMLDRGEKLRRRIQGQKDSGDESEDESDDDGEGGLEGLKAKAFEELAELKRSDELPEAGKGKSVFDMKFMRDAATREQADLNKDVDDFMKEIGEDGVDEEDTRDDGGAVIERAGGRMSFRPGVPVPRRVAHSDTSSITLQSADLLSQPNDTAASPVQTTTTLPIQPAVPSSNSTNQHNPWLAHADHLSGTGPKKSEVVVGKDSKVTEKSKNKLRKRKQQREEEKEREKEDAVVEISLDNTMKTKDDVSLPSSSAKSIAKGKVKTSAIAAKDHDSDANSEVEEQEKTIQAKGQGKRANGVKAFQQRDLVALAFAGDNVVQDFAETKRREIQADAPKEVDTTLPGWGAWGGTGTKKQAPKPHLVKKVAGVDPKSRADYGKAHVIISEKKDKKAAKYMVKDLPYPYTSKAQFEKSLDTPIGPEWNTRVGFQRGTLPKITKKMGTIINPLEKLH